MTHIRQEYETTLKGLMPASLRQELEDTIVSLKSQVNSTIRLFGLGENLSLLGKKFGQKYWISLKNKWWQRLHASHSIIFHKAFLL